MTPKQILKKAIEKAYKNGWGKGVDCQRLSWTIAHDVNFMNYWYWYSIIFSHDFAKAFAKYLLKEKAKFVSERVSYEYEEYETRLEICGERLHPYDGFYFEDEPKDSKTEDLLTNDKIIEDLKDWLLIQMVLEKEPLKYLEKFLEK